MTIWAHLLPELKRQGFKRTGRDNDLVTYEKIQGDRKLIIRLWIDGTFRISHYHKGLTDYGLMNTPPTYFLTVEEMRLAIEHELTRTDYPVMRSMDSI